MQTQRRKSSFLAQVQTKKKKTKNTKNMSELNSTFYLLIVLYFFDFQTKIKKALDFFLHKVKKIIAKER